MVSFITRIVIRTSHCEGMFNRFRDSCNAGVCFERSANLFMSINEKSHVYFLQKDLSFKLQHLLKLKQNDYKGFTSRYNCDQLVYVEAFDSIVEAIGREKQLKAGNRKRKEALINLENPDWLDLSEGWVFCFD